MQFWDKDSIFSRIKDKSFNLNAYELVFEGVKYAITVCCIFKNDLTQISARSLYLLFCDYCKVRFGPMSNCVLEELNIANGKQFKKILIILVNEGFLFCENVQFLDNKLGDNLDLTKRVIYTIEDWKQHLTVDVDK